MNNKLQKKNKGGYPSMDEILAEPMPIFKPEVIETLRLWKKCWYKKWGNLDTEAKLSHLNLLIEAIWEIKDPNHKNSVAGADYYAWHPASKTLLVDYARPSIISTLHEIGHSLYGASELEACRYSVWLFKIVFPRSFAQLESNGHMLRRKRSEDTVEGMTLCERSHKQSAVRQAHPL